MRLFGCTTVKAPDYSGLSYKNHTIAIYRDNKLTVGNIDGFFWADFFSKVLTKCRFCDILPLYSR